MEDQPTAFCPACKEDRELIDTERIRIPEGEQVREAMKGTCSVCGGAVISIISEEV